MGILRVNVVEIDFSRFGSGLRIWIGLRIYGSSFASTGSGTIAVVFVAGSRAEQQYQ